MKEHKCKYCGNSFMAYESANRQYCSKKCAIKKSWEKREKAKKVKFVCLQCKKEFELNACETRVKENKVHYCSAMCRDMAQRTGKIKKCKNCGKDFYTTRNSFCSKKCVYEYRKKTNKHKLYSENGYLVKFINGYNKKGNAKVHRLVIEKHLGRRLTAEEIVHHIDGNKINNNIDNLQVMTRSEHSKLHRKQELAQGKKLFENKYGIEIEEL